MYISSACALASVKSRLVSPFGYRLTWVVPEKRAVKWVCVCVCILQHKQLSGYLVAFLLAHPLFTRRRWGGLMFCWCFTFCYTCLVISVRPIISTSTEPIFTKFAGLLELWPQMNDLKLFFRSLVGHCHGNQFCISHDIRYSSAAGIRQERQLLCRAQANILPDSMNAGEPIN